jgi:cytoskeleton protein RodZ
MDMQETEFGHDTAALEEAQPLMLRPKPDGQHDPMGEAGWFLERERESRGESLEEVGDKIGIHPYHLEAIEFGDMTRMPARLEALEMISAYAQYLGFDPEPLVVHYVQHLPKPAVAPRASHPADPAPLSSAKVLFFGRMPKLPPLSINISKLPGGAGGLVASIAGAMILFMGANWMMTPDAPEGTPQMAQSAPSMPEVTTAAAGDVKITEEKIAEEQTATIDPGQPASDPLPAVDEGDGSVDGLGAFIAEQIPDKTGEQPPAAAGEAQQTAMAVDAIKQGADGSTIYGADNANARVVLKAKSAVWVRIEDSRGNVVMTQLLKAGDSYNVPDKKGLVVIARDGGLIAYSVDGVEKGILGTPGEILVGRSLDLEGLKG